MRSMGRISMSRGYGAGVTKEDIGALESADFEI